MVAKKMQRPNLDEYENTIYEFLLKNGGSSESYIRKNMDFPELTVRRKIRSLLTKGVIEDRKVGGRIHKLYVNDRTKFARVEKMLQTIEEEITSFDAPVAWLNATGTQKFPQDIQALKWKEICTFPYIELMATMLRILYMQESGISKVDSQTLHEKNITLFRKLTLQTINMDNEKQVLNKCREDFKKAIGYVKSNPILRQVFNPIVFKKLIKMSEDFEKEYLIQTK